MNRDARSIDLRLFSVYVVASLAAIFYLPTLVPMHPSASDSYLFGYNNRAGVALLLLLVSIGAIWTKGFNLEFFAAEASEPVPQRTLLISLLGVLCACLAMYMLAGRFGGFGESSYEIDRVWLTAQGRTPYVDFEWPFGAALLYGPLLISRLFSAGITTAYYVFWMINCLLGVLLLWAVINLIDYPTKHKKAIFLLLYGAWFLAIINMGTHYALVRYTCPLLFILVVHKVFRHREIRPRLYAVLLALLFTIILLLISPETAIAFAFASTCLFLFADPGGSGKTRAIFAWWLLAVAIVFGTALKLHVLDTVKASGGGADSFPVSSAPHFLLFFAALFICACYIFRRFTERRINDNTLGLLAYSVPMLAAALGRADPGHVVFNGLGLILASLFYVSNYPIAWKWYRTAFVVVMIVVPGVIGIISYRPLIMRCGLNILSENGGESLLGRSLIKLGHGYIANFASPAKRAKFEDTLEHAQHTSMATAVDLSILYPSSQGIFLAPFGYKPNGIGTYLNSRVEYGHFEECRMQTHQRQSSKSFKRSNSIENRRFYFQITLRVSAESMFGKRGPRLVSYSPFHILESPFIRKAFVGQFATIFLRITNWNKRRHSKPLGMDCGSQNQTKSRLHNRLTASRISPASSLSVAHPETARHLQTCYSEAMGSRVIFRKTSEVSRCSGSTGQKLHLDSSYFLP